MIKLAICTSKGGVGKTTLALELAAGLGKRGYRTLLVDMDCQGSASEGCGLDTESLEHTIKDVLDGDKQLSEVIRQTPFGDMVPNNLLLFNADTTYTQMGAMRKLKRALETVEDRYDFAILDCAPAFGYLTLSSLIAANGVIVPQLASIFSLISIKQLKVMLATTREEENENLKVLGIVLTKWSPRTNFSRGVLEVMREKAMTELDTTVFDATIRQAIAVEESIMQSQNIFDYDPKAKVVRDFNAFTDEVLERVSKILKQEQ